MNSFFADLHCHPTVIPFNLELDPWEPFILHHASQASFDALTRGNVKIIGACLYPIEHGFLEIKGIPSNLLDTVFKLISIMIDKRYDELVSEDHSYFEDVLKEYAVLKNIQPNPKNGMKVEVTRSYERLKELFSIDDNFNVGNPDAKVIAAIPTIEGAHGLGAGQKNTASIDPENLSNPQTVAWMNQMLDNISKLKNPADGSPAPLFISFSHHFWNQLCGHTVSFYNKSFLNQEAPQNVNFDRSFTALGEVVFKSLLDTSNGPRIYIDTRHMTVNARLAYYAYAQANGIPVLASHSSYNAKATIAASYTGIGKPADETMNEYADKLYEASNVFNPWDINLTDEEIGMIYQSGGVIGLNFDQHVIAGYKSVKKMKCKSTFCFAAGKRRIWIEPFALNIIKIAEAIKNKSGLNDDTIWQYCCIGSDFDGAIKSTPPFDSAQTLPDWADALLEYFKKNRTGLLSGKTDAALEQIVENVAHKNALRFLSRVM
ncbi:MAG: hypothetical protein V2A54_07605 [Bacteroidota bacterium]